MQFSNYDETVECSLLVGVWSSIVLLTGIELNETGILSSDVDGSSASIFLCDVNAHFQYIRGCYRCFWTAAIVSIFAAVIAVSGQLDLLETEKRALTGG